MLLMMWLGLRGILWGEFLQGTMHEKDRDGGSAAGEVGPCGGGGSMWGRTLVWGIHLLRGEGQLRRRLWLGPWEMASLGLRGLWGHEELAAYGNRQPCLRSKCGDPEGFLGVQIPGALR